MTKTEKSKSKAVKHSALAKQPSKFEPDPEAYSKAKPEQAPPPQAEAPKEQPPKEQPVEEEGGSYLVLGAGYKMRHRAGSAHSIVTRIVAKEGRFPEIVGILSAGFDPTNRDQANVLLGKMFVQRESVEDMTRADPEFKAHASKKMATLKSRAEKGDAKAKAVISKDARVKDGKWVGDIREVISTCNGSYTTENKNVRKFKDAGLIFRQHPLDPDKNDKVYLMLYPSKYSSKIDKAIATVFGKGK
jgi:hypothetical protein